MQATLENDKVTERQISRISLLNVALYCGSVERARDLYDSSNFEKEEMDKAMMQGTFISTTAVNCHAVAMSRKGHCPFMSFF